MPRLARPSHLSRRCVALLQKASQRASTTWVALEPDIFLGSATEQRGAHPWGKAVEGSAVCPLDAQSRLRRRPSGLGLDLCSRLQAEFDPLADQPSTGARASGSAATVKESMRLEAAPMLFRREGREGKERRREGREGGREREGGRGREGVVWPTTRAN